MCPYFANQKECSPLGTTTTTMSKCEPGQFSVFDTAGMSLTIRFVVCTRYSTALRRLLSIAQRMAAEIAAGVQAPGSKPVWCSHAGLRRIIGEHSDCSGAVTNSVQDDGQLFFPTSEDVHSLAETAHSSPVLLTTTKFADRVVSAFQRVLFQWHVDNFWCRRDSTGQGACTVCASKRVLGSGCGVWMSLARHVAHLAFILCGCSWLTQAHNFSHAEAAYLRQYFDLSGAELRNFGLTGHWVGNRMSSYSYSHRVKPYSNRSSASTSSQENEVEVRVDGDETADHSQRRRNVIAAAAPPPLRVDSARFRVGTTSQEHLLLPYALAVLRERNISPPKGLCTRDNAAANLTGVRLCTDEEPGAQEESRPSKKNEAHAEDVGLFIFYGFGWDMGVDAFKVYYMFHGLHSVPESLRRNAGINVRILQSVLQGTAFAHREIADPPWLHDVRRPTMHRIRTT